MLFYFITKASASFFPVYFDKFFVTNKTTESSDEAVSELFYQRFPWMIQLAHIATW